MRRKDGSFLRQRAARHFDQGTRDVLSVVGGGDWPTRFHGYAVDTNLPPLRRAGYKLDAPLPGMTRCKLPSSTQAQVMHHITTLCERRGGAGARLRVVTAEEERLAA
ncbi:MAG: hypothetical protein ACLT9P_03235 [Evtepia gabavorous]